MFDIMGGGDSFFMKQMMKKILPEVPKVMEAILVAARKAHIDDLDPEKGEVDIYAAFHIHKGIPRCTVMGMNEAGTPTRPITSHTGKDLVDLLQNIEKEKIEEKDGGQARIG